MLSRAMHFEKALGEKGRRVTSAVLWGQFVAACAIILVASSYNIITFGFLDSHRLFSSMSSVRLDNYLYTVENMENIEEQLQEGGVLAISYTVHEQWIADRLFNLLSSSFNQVPVVYQGDEAAWGTIFLVRKGTPLSQPESLIGRSEFEATILPAAANNSWAYSKRNGFLSPEVFSSTSLLPTDDWPHLYMEKRGIPTNYLAILVLIFSFSLLLVGLPEPVHRLPPDTLGGAVGIMQIRMRRLQLLKLTQQHVVFRVGHRRRAVDPVRAVGLFQQGAQFKNPTLFRALRHRYLALRPSDPPVPSFPMANGNLRHVGASF